jgi:hypothetical protein
MDSPRSKPSRGARLSKRSQRSESQDVAIARAAPVRRVELLGAFRDECEQAVAGIRQAVRALCDAVGADPLKPQDLSRRLKLNKNLTWKFARIMIEQDALDAAPMLPGPEGIAIYLRAFESAGVSKALLASLRVAIASFDAMVGRHFGGRADFELALDGIRAGANLEQSRRLAFRGAAAVFGVQAAARVTAQIIYPGAGAPAAADMALVVGLVGLRRLRPIARLPVFRSTTAAVAAAESKPLLGGPDGSPADYLIRDFSSFPETEVVRTETGEQLTIELANGPIGRIGEADLFFGSVRGGSYSTRRAAEGDRAEFLTRVTIPSEFLVSDIFVHRSIAGPESAETAVYGLLSGNLPPDDAAREVVRIPIDATPTVHDALPADRFAQCVETAAVPNYPALLRRAFDALALDPADFRLIRVALPFPAVPSTLSVRWPLPS